MTRDRWWVFDRPLLRDWLFLVGIAVGLFGVVRVGLDSDRFGAGAFVVQMIVQFMGGIFWTAVLGGTIREYLRARRGATPAS